MFWDALPQYLAIGMSADEFWHGHLRLCQAYREAYRVQRENREWAEWRMGVYVREAMRSVAPAFREFSSGEEHEYPIAPLFSGESNAELEEMRKEKAHMEHMQANVMAFATAFNRRFESGE